MAALLIMLLKYFFSWLVMCSTLFLALIAESIDTFILNRIKGIKKSNIRTLLLPLRAALHSMNVKIALPETACSVIALYFPGLALAAVIPICASVPLSSLVPILDNGGDMVQILLFAVLSEVFATVAVYSLGTSCALITARRMTKEMIMIMLPLMACFSSIAAFFAVLGIQGDTFGLNAFTLSMHIESLHWYGFIGIAIFIFVIYSQIPHSNAGLGCVVFEAGELPEYQGCPRVILQLWSVFRAFIVVAVVTHIFFPWGYFKGLNAGFSISWWAQLINFFAFWVVVILVRVFIVTLCWKGMEALERAFPRVPDFMLILTLTMTAAMLVIYEGIKLSMELSAF